MATIRMLFIALSTLLVAACSGTMMPSRYNAYYAGGTCPAEAVAICDVHSLAGCRCTIIVAD